MNKSILATLSVVLAACGGAPDEPEVRSVSCTQRTSNVSSSTSNITISCNEIDPRVAQGNVPAPAITGYNASVKP